LQTIISTKNEEELMKANS